MNSNCSTAVSCIMYMGPFFMNLCPVYYWSLGGGPCGGLLLRGWRVKKGRGGGKREARYKVVGKVEGKREERDGDRKGE